MGYDDWKTGHYDVEPERECEDCRYKLSVFENLAYHLKDMQGVIMNAKSPVPSEIIRCLRCACEELEGVLEEQVYYLPDPLHTQDEKNDLAERLFKDLQHMNEVLYGNK